MNIEKTIIEDQKETIKRLQQECTELRQLGLNLQEKVHDYEEANERLEVDNREIRRKLDEWEKELQSNERIINKLIKQVDSYKQENIELKEKNEQLENKLQLRMASDKESDAYWDSIFDEDYPFNKENAYKELCDYYFVLNQLPEIYLYITGGRLSKTTYFASSVKEAFDDAIQHYYDKIDDLEYSIEQYKQALEEIRVISDNYNLTVNKRREQIANKINEVLK